jgi:hypothetical protein
MSVAIENYKELLDGGPPCRLQRSLGLIKPDDSRIARRAELSVLVGWAPLVVLAVVEGLVLRNHVAESFFSDFAVHARSLLAAPMLILAEADCTPRLGRVADRGERLRHKRHPAQIGVRSTTGRCSIATGGAGLAAGYAAQRCHRKFGEAAAVVMKKVVK